MPDLIRRMAHVALEVPDLDASVRWATTIMGLREVERRDGVAYLSHADCHHSLEYHAGARAALHHVSLQAHDDAALDALASAVDAEACDEPRVPRALRFRAPAGHLIEVFAHMDSDGEVHTGRGVQPRKFGHPMLTCEDTGPTRAFFEDVLGFRLSDDIGDGTLVFPRHGVDHHGLGIQRGPHAGLNHYAWGVQSLSELGRLGDVLASHGSSLIWGPGRHGAGLNLFTYHFDPAGCIVEYYADLYQVWDERTYVPGRWSLDDPRPQNLWGAGAPAPMLETATPLS